MTVCIQEYYLILSCAFVSGTSGFLFLESHLKITGIAMYLEGELCFIFLKNYYYISKISKGRHE